MITCVTFSKGEPFRKPFYTNKLYTGAILALLLFNSIVVLAPLSAEGWLYKKFLQLLPIPEWYRLRFVAVGIVINMILTVAVEHLIITKFVQ